MLPAMSPTSSAGEAASSFPIASVVVGRGDGVIGMAFCPGRTLDGLAVPGWDRDLAADLDVVRQFGASALVSLMQAPELAHYGVPVGRLETEVRARSMDWYHLPIIDMDVPDERFEATWLDMGEQIRERLASGASVVIHCLGGLGRTGMITGRLLIEFGAEPDEAIAAVRAARPGAVQTFAQERYLRDLAGGRDRSSS
jgi:ADP-ribosyl-[dinitrogen reductase] hydrolase